MWSSVRVSAAASATLRRSLVSASQANNRRLFSASSIQRAAQGTPSGASGKSGSSWLTVTGLTILAATSGYYLFSPVE
ncbi:hypothetical protein BGZ49_003688, partial [Haplosporangium sp. Z 27]